MQQSLICTHVTVYMPPLRTPSLYEPVSFIPEQCTLLGPPMHISIIKAGHQPSEREVAVIYCAWQTAWATSCFFLVAMCQHGCVT